MFYVAFHPDGLGGNSVSASSCSSQCDVEFEGWDVLFVEVVLVMFFGMFAESLGFIKGDGDPFEFFV